MAMSGIMFLFFPLLMLTVISLLWLILGVRKTNQPTCRACGDSLANFGTPFANCPGCNCETTRPRAVRFLGRRRPLGLWLLTAFLVLPVLGIGFLITALAIGTITPRTLDQMISVVPVTGDLTPNQARGLSTDDLIDTLGTYPGGSWGWQELRERLDNEPPSDERMLAVLDTISDAMVIINANPNPNTPGYDYGRSFKLAMEHLGYGHPRVQKFLNTHLTTPNGCPTITVRNPSKPYLNLAMPIPMTTQGGSVLFHAMSSNEVHNYTTAIRIDGIDVPQRSDGKRNWFPNDSSHHNLQTNALPANAMEPGTHTLEIDVFNAVLPIETSTGLDRDLWPSTVVIKSATIECDYTIKEPPPATP